MKFSKLFFWLIFSILIFGIACEQSDSENDFIAEPIIGGKSVIITGYVGSKWTVRIPSRIQKLPVTHIGNGAFKGKNLVNVSIPHSVTHIGDEAFAENKLSNLIIPKSIIDIGNGSFRNNQLTELIIPKNVEYIRDIAFAYNHLTSINVDNNVIKIGIGAFAFNDKLTNINISSSIANINNNESAVNKQLTNVDPINNIQITYYLSDKLKEIHPMPDEIITQIWEYAKFSRGKIQFSVKDPIKENLTHIIEQLGIIPNQIQTMNDDHSSIMTVYTGIGIEYHDKTEVIPVIFSIESLEYNLASRIQSLLRDRPYLLGVILGEISHNWDSDYRDLQISLIQAGYQLKLIDLDYELMPDELSVLLILGGTETLNDVSLFQIDRFIQMGGKAFFNVKSIHIDIGGGLTARTLVDKGLLSMLKSYGIELLQEIVMDRSSLAMQYQTRTPSGAVQSRIVRNPQWIKVLGENGNSSNPIGLNFGGLDLYWANPIILNTPKLVDAYYLFTTTDEAWSMKEPFFTSPETTYLFERDATETKGKKILGASLSGIFPAYFLDKQKPKHNILNLPEMPSQTKSSRIIVVSETYFATSFMNTTGGQRNLDFILETIGWLCYDEL